MFPRKLTLEDARFAEWLPGDIVACYGTCVTARAIRFGTACPWPFAPRRLRLGPSHVGMIVPFQNELLWWESTSLGRRLCRVRRTMTIGVQAHLPADRIADYYAEGGVVDVYRLSAIDLLTVEEQTELAENAVRFLGIKYDTRGALISGMRIRKALRLLPERALSSVFCSEWIAAMLMRVHVMNRDNPTRYNPSSLLRQLVYTGSHGWLRRHEAAEPPVPFDVAA